MSRRRRKARASQKPAAPPPPAKSPFEQAFDKVAGAAKQATVKVLNAVEEDPERALAGVGHVLGEGERMIRQVKDLPAESRRALRNELFSLAAKGIKKALG